VNACRIQLDHQIEWTQPEQKVSKRHASNSDKNASLASHCRERNKFLYSRPRSDILARPPCDVSNIGSVGEIRAPSRLMTTRRVQTANSRAIWRTPATSTSGLFLTGKMSPRRRRVRHTAGRVDIKTSEFGELGIQSNASNRHARARENVARFTQIEQRWSA